MLQSMGSQRVKHDLVTEQQKNNCLYRKGEMGVFKYMGHERRGKEK